MPADLTREEIEVRVGKIRANVRSSQSRHNQASAALQAPADMAWLLGVADLALNLMDEIERYDEKDRAKTREINILVPENRALTADLAAAQVTIRRIEALAHELADCDIPSHYGICGPVANRLFAALAPKEDVNV